MRGGGILINKIRLVNIQAYRDVTFNLSDGINVFNAPNETGKSIIFKVFRKMCDANWFGRSNRQDIVRRGCNRGIALIVLSEKNGHNYRVMFELYKTYQVYRLFEGAEEIDSWKQDTLPNELYGVLGWSYDKDSKRLLNLCDQELDMPFVNSNNNSNYEAMKFILKDDRLESAKDNLGIWTQELTNADRDVTRQIDRYKSMIDSMPIIDTVAIQDSIDIREKNIVVARDAYLLIEALNSCIELIAPKRPRNVMDDKELDKDINIMEKLYDFGITLQNAVKEKKPRISRVIDTSEVERCLLVLDKLSDIRDCMYGILYTIQNRKAVKMKIKNTRELIEDYEMEHKICPLCGNQFCTEVHDTEVKEGV